MSQKIMTIPLFPLPDAVFFPHTILPLHVFEPRYKSMVGEALEGDRLIGVVQLRPGWKESYYDSPPVFKVLGVGRIEEADRWEDGRYDIILNGLYRTKLREETVQEPYRMAQVEVIEDLIPPEKSHEVDDVHTLLLQIYHKLSDALPDDMTILPGAEVDTLTPGMLSDVLASLLVNDPYERQSLLSEPDVSRRQQLLRVHIQAMFNPEMNPDTE